MQSASSKILGQDGSLKKVYPRFTPRAAQIEMAESIEFAIEKNQTAVIEAGTGIGKTFAYLIPALLSGKKIIVSTGTKNLQDQLYNKDLPLLRKLFPVKKVSLLKGRANYLCLHRLEANAPDALYETRGALKDLTKVNRWAKLTKSGDIAELTTIKESSQIWPNVTSTSENCIGSECPCFHKCFVSKARKEALVSDLVIINHHLFFADLAIKDEGFGELLPDARVVIFDEAHHLAEIATNFFSQSISSRKLGILINDILAAYYELSQDLKELPELLTQLRQTLKKVRLAFGKDMRREAWEVVANKREIKLVFDLLQEQFASRVELLSHLSQRSKDLHSCYERAVELFHLIDQLLDQEKSGEYVYWFETYAQSFVVYITPIQIKDELQKFINQPDKAWVFTSATLAIGDSFDFFTQPLGIKANCLKQLLSPYDYKKNTMLYIPQGLPDVRDSNFMDKLITYALPIITASKGRSFLLFTSYSAMYKAKDLLLNSGFELFVQGDKTKHQLLEDFRNTPNAILLGTSSFWQGVDVQGEALSCVIIDKLPFASPGEPIVKARINAIKKQGGNAFFDYQLPHAVIALKQGVGRLIRGEQDKGILVIADMRLLTKNYGAQFLSSLPTMPIVRQHDRALESAEKLLGESRESETISD